MAFEVIGVDPSYTSTGVATASGVSSFELKGDGRERLEHAYRWAKLFKGKPVVVFIEGYAPGRNNRAHQMGELGGVLRLGFTHAGIEYRDVSPPTVKKYATGKGNAGKDQVLAEAIRRLGYEGHSTDEADALWLRQIGLALTGGDAVDVPQAHRAALDVLR